MKSYNLAIIGAGPGGYVAAIRAAKEGLSVALVSGDDLGGTCLNRGCIPSKTMLKHAEVIEDIKGAKTYGITVNDFSFSIKDMVGRKTKVVKTLKNGIKGLMKQNKIEVFSGIGSVQEDKTVIIASNGGTETIQADNVMLANGSKPLVPPLPGIDDIGYYTSDTIFDIEEVPAHMVIMGGGVIGLEIACIFNSLDTKVEIVEMADRILPTEDPDASDYLKRELSKKGIGIQTGAKITGFSKNGQKTTVDVETSDGNKNTIETDSVLVAVGRQPNLTGIDNLGVTFDGKFVKVDQNLQTSAAGIYAIGDLIGGYQFAHAASDEGIRAVTHIAGKAGHGSQPESTIPRCVYTFPEVASVGMTEAQVKEKGYRVKTKKVDIAANGKAIAAGETSGFMKLISEEKYGEVLGVVMVGAHVTEMISQATAYMHLEGTAEELDSMVFPHPTVSEALGEAGSVWLEKGIHYS
ncbi:dihydrolipoyl dehydrogenase [Lentibacillus amyloliquefaciens]|uniref:Dihydrolipoyl dehydrogenase n=1 Tax=Lentibacillus amyloliquefaciens TaxID=1472767 RepID=A0A0U4FMX8_9BACI|nr:dihydrolipoyl dehydrogenase [Lentibacillus amyloliquefaciens]ALX49998.1 acetoin dehydrogenase [Lentibacillus amyloliquefaciens]